MSVRQAVSVRRSGGGGSLAIAAGAMVVAFAVVVAGACGGGGVGGGGGKDGSAGTGGGRGGGGGAGDVAGAGGGAGAGGASGATGAGGGATDARGSSDAADARNGADATDARPSTDAPGATDATADAPATADARPADAPTTGTPSLCAPGKYLVCESFEATATGAIPTGWTRQGSAALVRVSAAAAARGQHALEIGAAMNGARRITMPAAAFGAEHWGRIFYRVQTPAPMPPDGAVIHSTLVALTGPNPQASGTEEVRVVDTVENLTHRHQFLYNVQPQGSEFATGGPYNWSYESVWHCAEWHIDYATQSYNFYFDGAEVTQIAKNNGPGNFRGTGIPESFTSIAIGWNNYQSTCPDPADTAHCSPGFVAWIDEIAIDRTRIGCGN